jgi:fructokinase
VPRHSLVLGIGEALFDVFAGTAVLGGAPVNFTVHVHRLLAASGAGTAALVSRIGADESGRTLLGELEQRGVATTWVQIDPHCATGAALVTLDAAGQPSYEIVRDAAWDKLAWDAALGELAGRCAGLCFGTLAQRSAPAAATITRLVSGASAAIRLFDVNLRQHYFDRPVLRRSFEIASVAKLNEEELARVSRLLFGASAQDTGANGAAAERQDAIRLLDEFGLELVAISRGARGTVFHTGAGIVDAEPPVVRPDPDADSVGAGDACCAGILFGLLQGWPLERTLELANRMGALVAARAGATPELPVELLEFARAS